MKLGAFLAGALLAETNFRTQIEADIRPFRGLLLGLFFVTTGTSIDMEVKLLYLHKDSQLKRFSVHAHVWLKTFFAGSV